MKIQFTHPSAIDIDAVYSLALDKDATIRTSPHIGNLDQLNNPHYLALALGGVPLEIVDTITVNDRNGRPGILVQGGVEIDLEHNLSRENRKKTHPCAASAASRTLTKIHTDPLEQKGIIFTLSSRFPGIVNVDLPKVLMYVIGESQRLRVARNGVVSLNTQNRLTPTVPNLNKLGIYGQDPNPLSGLILPVEALVATEIVQATISTQDRVTHIGGADMVRYMRNPQFQNRVLELAKAALTELGISHPDQIIYTVLNKNGGISGLKEESDRLSDRFGFPNFSQHDL